MSKKRYRTRPGMPRTETEAMVRALAMEMLDGSLRELEHEIAVLQVTVDLYFAEANERKRNPTKDYGRWQVAPGVGLRALAMLRKLREKRDTMLAEAETEIVEQALSEGAKKKVENPNQPAPSPQAAESRDAGSNDTSAMPSAAPRPPDKQTNASPPERPHDQAAAA